VDFDGAEFKRPDVIVYGNQHTQTMKKMLVLNSVTYAVSIQSQNKKNALAYYFSITTLHKIGLDYHWNSSVKYTPLQVHPLVCKWASSVAAPKSTSSLSFQTRPSSHQECFVSTLACP